MTDDELTALEHENWIAYVTGVVSCTRRAQVTLARRGGGQYVTGLPFDSFNQLLIERQESDRRRPPRRCRPGARAG